MTVGMKLRLAIHQWQLNDRKRATTMKTLTLCAPAKINLFLHITGQRSDGYHNLQTAFQLLDFGDQIELELTNGTDIKLINPLPDIDNRDNLVIRAAQLLQNHWRIGHSAGLKLS